MPEWLELELAHHLAPVEAPKELRWHKPEPPAPRWSLRLTPILGLAAALALVLLATAPGRLSPTAANRYLRRAGIGLAIPADTRARIQRVSSGNARGAVTYQLAGLESTVWIAKAGSVSGPEWKSHGNYAIAGSCALCHANL